MVNWLNGYTATHLLKGEEVQSIEHIKTKL